MRERKSEDEQHYHSRDGYDHISSSSSSTYIQLRNNHHHHRQHKYLLLKSKHSSLLHFTHIRLQLIIFLFTFLFLLLLFFIFFPLQKASSSTSFNYRSKRQIFPVNNTIYRNDKQHYTTMLRRILLHRTSSSVLADCSINMASDGIYRLPSPNTLSAEIIDLVEKRFQKELFALKRSAAHIRLKLNQSAEYTGDFGLAKFRDDFSIPLRLLLASQFSIKELALMLARPFPNDNNGGSYIYYDTIKYQRSSNGTRSASSFIDYEAIVDVKLKQNGNSILQTFTSLNARETVRQAISNNYPAINDGWWIGPVLCEKNRNETFLMAHIFPLADSYFLVSYFNISDVDINQCASFDEPFGETHKCPAGAQCIHQPGRGFTVGAYQCRCSSTVDSASLTLNGNDLESNETVGESSLHSPISACECNPEVCRARSNRFLRTIIIVVQSICIVFVAILAAIVFQRRKTKIIKHSMWILLELILLGAVLLYASVIVDSFGPHGVVCLIMPWLRELGFIIVYGTLILRIYKMLAEFQSRKAHCVQVKEKDMLRVLSFLIISITGYLLGWTLVNIDHANEDIFLGRYLLGNGQVRNEKIFFQTCRPRSWDYLVQFAEFIFLCVGIRFIYSTRTAPCEYHERKLITVVIGCEMIFSTLLHVIKDILWSTVNPDALFLLSVLRCHFTVTIMVVLIFCTKLCYIFRWLNEEYTGRDRFRSVPDGLEPADLVAKLHSNGDVDFGELNLRDMDPEEIRAELKRLYTSLHVLKTKTMRKDNPHLTKRHGQRRKHRRFSMQAFQRHGGGHAANPSVGGPISTMLSSGDKHDVDPTKTPEDSTGSHNEHTHLGGMSMHRGSLDESDDAHGRTLSDLTSAMASSALGQRVTFK